MFDWNDFKTLAEELRQRNDEAAQRTAISRVYYAVYWRARNFLESEAFTLRNTKHHIFKSGTNTNKRQVKLIKPSANLEANYIVFEFKLIMLLK